MMLGSTNANMHRDSNRQSHRLKDYDYSQPGAYFVTIATQNHRCIFGKISDSIVSLSSLGRIVQECWHRLPNHFPLIDVEPFIVMPNHVHGIITISEGGCRGTIYRAPTKYEKFGKPMIGSLPTIIRTYKAAVTRQSNNELGVKNIWQRNYYDHIIRNEQEYTNIYDYIVSNPRNWDVDRNDLYPFFSFFSCDLKKAD
jgi:putative transposase